MLRLDPTSSRCSVKNGRRTRQMHERCVAISRCRFGTGVKATGGDATTVPGVHNAGRLPGLSLRGCCRGATLVLHLQAQRLLPQRVDDLIKIIAVHSAAAAPTAAPQALVAHAAQRWCGLQAGPAPAANDAVGADLTTIRPARLATQHYDVQSDALRSVPAGLMLCITRIGTGGPTICCFRTGDALSRSFQAAAVASQQCIALAIVRLNAQSLSSTESGTCEKLHCRSADQTEGT